MLSKIRVSKVNIESHNEPIDKVGRAFVLQKK